MKMTVREVFEKRLDARSDYVVRIHGNDVYLILETSRAGHYRLHHRGLMDGDSIFVSDKDWLDVYKLVDPVDLSDARIWLSNWWEETDGDGEHRGYIRRSLDILKKLLE